MSVCLFCVLWLEISPDGLMLIDLDTIIGASLWLAQWSGCMRGLSNPSGVTKGYGAQAVHHNSTLGPTRISARYMVTAKITMEIL